MIESVQRFADAQEPTIILFIIVLCTVGIFGFLRARNDKWKLMVWRDGWSLLWRSAVALLLIYLWYEAAMITNNRILNGITLVILSYFNIRLIRKA